MFISFPLCIDIQVGFKTCCQFEYKEILSVVTRRSGRNVSLVIMQGERKPGEHIRYNQQWIERSL